MNARHKGQDRSVGARRRGALARACVALFVASPLVLALQDDGDTFIPRPFQLYDTQGARARADEASEHITAERWSEALAALQALIEDHRGEVLGASRPQPADARHPSQHNVHWGAGSWAALQLFGLPKAAKVLYRERFGRRADDALRRAIAASDRGALARVAQRWPLTAAAESAWWALGDLEIELGHAGDGVRSWARAAALRVEDPLRVTTTAEQWRLLRDDLAQAADVPPGAVARTQMAIDLLPNLSSEGGSRPENEASFVRGPASGIAATSITSSRFAQTGAAGWPKPFRLPSTPYSNVNGPSRLFPQRAGDVLLINTSRSVHALDAFDGTEIWRLDPAQLNWRHLSVAEIVEYDEAVDTDERIVTVAVSDGVVIAPVQIPWTFEKADNYNDLTIIEIIPERRLVALDLATGDPLWNTFPPYDWDGDSGTFAERMTVVGPPTIVGARVLVPMARLRGRIEMHLGCFDLTTGEVLWSAPLVTGQRTLNMFGRANVEFSAPPPVIAGDSVIVATQLGIVASIDLFTGETRWNTLYEQVPIQAPQYFRPGSMQNKWRNAPPQVVGDTIIVAPFDGKELFALDATSGAMLWSIKRDVLMAAIGIRGGFSSRGRTGGLNLLLAADERHLILGGTSVASIEFSDGLRAGTHFEKAWSWPPDRLLRTNGGYPAVDAESVFIPYGGGVMIVDRESGRVREELTGAAGGGHLLVADGMLFSADGAQVDARFEWIAMVERARAALRGDDATAANLDVLVRLLLERSESLLDRGTDVARALALTKEAERALTGFEPDTERLTATSDNDAHNRTTQRHRALMIRVRGERIRGDSDAARRAAQAALELDRDFNLRDPSRRLEALLALHEIEKARNAAARAEILDELLAEHAQQTIEIEARVAGGRWSPSVALSLVLESIRSSRSSGSRLVTGSAWSDPWSGPITPTLVALSGRRKAGEDDFERRRASITVGLFALLSQVEIARTIAAPEQSIAGELLGLHAILRETPKETFFGAVSGDWAAARIRAIRALSPSSSAIDRFDGQAEAMFERARRIAETEGSTDELDEIRVLFPGSPAASSAAEARIEFALASGSPHEVAAIVVEAMSDGWHPARSTGRETSLLLQLAATLGDAGNIELQAGIAANLAHYHPESIVDIPEYGSVTLTDLAQRWKAKIRPVTAHAATFDNRVVAQRTTEGDFVPIGRISLAGSENGEAREALIVQSGDVQLALAPGKSGAPLWSRSSVLGSNRLYRKERVHLGEDSIIVGEHKRVVCIDPATGGERWSFSRPNRSINRIRVAGGVVVVVTARRGTGEPAEVHGLDAVLGIELWQLGMIAGRYDANVKVGDGHLVLLPVRGTHAAVHDLYTGYPVTAILTGRMTSKDAKAAWIGRRRLVTAFLDGGRSRQARNAIIAYELDDGVEAWRIDLDNHAGSIQTLTGLIEMPANTAGRETVRLAMLQQVHDRRSANRLQRRETGLYVLNERLGALGRTPLVSLDARTHLVGIDGRPVVRVEEPLLIAVRAGEGDDPALISAIDPRIGVIWKALSMRPIRASGVEQLALPVVGDGVIAMMVTETFGRASSGYAEKKLMFLDSVSGRHVETRPLEAGSSPAIWKYLGSVGGTLVAMGSQRMTVME